MWTPSLYRVLEAAVHGTRKQYDIYHRCFSFWRFRGDKHLFEWFWSGQTRFHCIPSRGPCRFGCGCALQECSTNSVDWPHPLHIDPRKLRTLQSGPEPPPELGSQNGPKKGRSPRMDLSGASGSWSHGSWTPQTWLKDLSRLGSSRTFREGGTGVGVSKGGGTTGALGFDICLCTGVHESLVSSLAWSLSFFLPKAHDIQTFSHDLAIQLHGGEKPSWHQLQELFGLVTWSEGPSRIGGVLAVVINHDPSNSYYIIMWTSLPSTSLVEMPHFRDELLQKQSDWTFGQGPGSYARSDTNEQSEPTSLHHNGISLG